jgi:hypothetical protein
VTRATGDQLRALSAKLRDAAAAYQAALGDDYGQTMAVRADGLDAQAATADEEMSTLREDLLALDGLVLDETEVDVIAGQLFALGYAKQ